MYKQIEESRFKARKGITFQKNAVKVCFGHRVRFVNWMNFRINMILIIWLGCVEYPAVPASLCLTQKFPSHCHHLHSTLSQSALQIIQWRKSPLNCQFFIFSFFCSINQRWNTINWQAPTNNPKWECWGGVILLLSWWTNNILRACPYRTLF